MLVNVLFQGFLGTNLVIFPVHLPQDFHVNRVQRMYPSLPDNQTLKGPGNQREFARVQYYRIFLHLRDQAIQGLEINLCCEFFEARNIQLNAVNIVAQDDLIITYGFDITIACLIYIEVKRCGFLGKNPA